MDTKMSSSSTKYFLMFIGVTGIMLATNLVTVLIMRSLRPAAICGEPAGPTWQRSFPRGQVNWEPADTLDVPGKEYTVKKAGGECYIYKTALRKGVNRQLEIIPKVLHNDMVRSLAGEVALEMCEGIPVLLAVDAGENLSREKRQASPAPLTGRNVGVNYDAPYDESVNDNRCMDAPQLIDCSATDAIGKTSSCHTGVNGFFWMERTCKSPTQIVVQMTKPPGRIIKHMQKQFFLCEDRRGQGLRC